MDQYDEGNLTEVEMGPLMKLEVNIDNDPKYTRKKKNILNNPYFSSQILICWFAIIVVFFAVMGLFEGNFFNIGPSSNVVLFGLKIDTWSKWTAIVVFNFIDMIIFEWSTEVIRPFILNEIQDPKSRELNISKTRVFLIINAYEFCTYVRHVINFSMVFTQIDLLFAVFLGNFVSQNLTTYNYIKDKKIVIE